MCEKITKGETLIEIVNAYDDVVQEVMLPANGYCVAFTGGMCGTHAVSEGTKLAIIYADRGELGE